VARQRLQKVLAESGVGSRRASEALIAAGRVSVDGRVAQLGDSADPDLERVLLDGRPIGPAATPVHLALNKPLDVTSTVRDRHADRTVIDLVPRALMPPAGRLYPVGRLDRDSEGLILLTNDGPWAELVSHPRHGVDREYALAVGAPLRAAQLEALEAGIRLDEGVATFVRLRRLTSADVARLGAVVAPPPDDSAAWYAVVLRQGWKRQVRRMFAVIEAPVGRLVRIRIGQVRLERLGPGKVRPLTDGEVRTLSGEPAPSRRPRRPPPSDGATPRKTSRATGAKSRRPGAPGQGGRRPPPAS
jgi:23S rRNA pseudouridine2605 synthase